MVNGPMYNNNTDGYKLIFYLENLIREYIHEYLPEQSFQGEFKRIAEQNFTDNSTSLQIIYRSLLDYLHLGQLYDLVNTKQFNSIKNNSINKINISTLVKRRNSVMHSRVINAEHFEEIKDICEKLIYSLDDEKYIAKFNMFISNEIEEYSVPLLFVEYPLGKNFERLIGREQELQNLKKAINIPTPVSIIRHGGVGKTALTLQLAEDLMYSPEKPFDRIYFMSFKNTVFTNGQIRKLEKVISNHNDLILKLAFYMNIDTSKDDFKNIESQVWHKMFSTKSLLILDNLETEVVRSNLSEFTAIADLFIRNYTNASRLLITSRYGLGDREQKFPLYELDIERTKELVKLQMREMDSKLKGVSIDDWKWVHDYSQGNPGLILSFCNTFKTTQKSLLDLRVEFNSKYSVESRELHDNQDTFLEFCFENTMVSMPRESQIFLAALCYLCDEAKISEISEELIAFIIDELQFEKLGIHNLRAANFVNIGFLHPVMGSDKYFVNELVIEYLNGNFSEENTLFTVFDLKKSEWFPLLKQIRSNILDIQFDEELSVGQIISRLYSAKYRVTNDPSYLYKSFICDCTTKNLSYYFDKANPQEVLNSFDLLDKLRAILLQKNDVSYQERIGQRIVFSLSVVNQLITTKKIRDFRQSDLSEYFEQLEKKLWIFRSNSLSIAFRTRICEFLISINWLDKAESYMQSFEGLMQRVAFELYTKKLGYYANIDKGKSEEYISKCQTVLNSKNNISKVAKARFYISSARYYSNISPRLAIKLATSLDEYTIDNSTLFSLHLESLLLRAQCLILIRGSRDVITEYISKYKQATKMPMYQQLFPKKRTRFQTDLQIIEKSLRSFKSN